MDDLISRLTAKTGVSEEQAKKAVAIILNFLNKSAPADKMQKLLDGMPEAKPYVTSDSSGGMMSGMMGAMAAMNEMTSTGMSMGEVQGVTKETIRYAKEKSGDDTVNDVIGSIPGLSQFI